MFQTLSFDSHNRSRKRAKVLRACDHCRVHRVRCDANRPCSQCVTNKVKCVQPGSAQVASDTPTEDLKHKPLAGVVNGSRQNNESRRELMDSTMGFMAKISDFCDSLSDYLARPAETEPPPYPSTDALGAPDCSSTPTTTLSQDTTARLLELYWHRSHHLLPITHPSTIKSMHESLWDEDGAEQRSEPLVDVIIAISLQHLHQSGENMRILNLGSDSDEKISLHYFRRCLEASNDFITASRPNSEHAMCYLLMAFFLLQGDQYQAAYNMIGLATRISHTLGLQEDVRDSLFTTHERRQLWWFIVHIDFRCARLLGRPMGIRPEDIDFGLPLWNHSSRDYDAVAVSLTKATLQVTIAASQRANQEDEDRVSQAEARAKQLSDELHPLHEWLNIQFRDFAGRLVSYNSCSPDKSSWIPPAASENPTKLLHEVLLELQYYDAMIGLHRPFISFPIQPFVPLRSPLADRHATTALNLAMASVHFTHSIMSASDVLYGRSDIYQWLWNALLTIIGFLMAHPLCELAPKARRHIQLASDIFDAASSRNKVAARAAALARFLQTKLDSLVEIVTPNDSTQTMERDGNIQRSDGRATEAESRHVPASDKSPGWADSMTDPDTWATYNDEISAALEDFTYLPFSNDGYIPFPP